MAKKEDELNLKKIELADLQTLGSRGSDEVLLEELSLVKARLAHKTQLLDKVKVLLTRAAAKERVLREQVNSYNKNILSIYFFFLIYFMFFYCA